MNTAPLSLVQRSGPGGGTKAAGPVGFMLTGLFFLFRSRFAWGPSPTRGGALRPETWGPNPASQ